MYVNRFKHRLDYHSRNIIINALIFSNINYCQIIWGRCSQKLLHKVQKSVNFAAKVVSNGRHVKRDRVTPLLKKLGWLEIANRIKLREGLYVYNSMRCPTGINRISFPRAETGGRSRRDQHRLVVPCRKTQAGHRALSVSGPVLWNTLPSEIKRAPFASTFKKLYTRLLLSQQFPKR